MKEGRILFYNPQTGEGKVILKTGEKGNFSAEIWDDFDVMPETGAIVKCNFENGVVTAIKAARDDSYQNAHVVDESIVPKDRNKGAPTFEVKKTLESYFKPIDFLIGEPPEVVNTKNQLDYSLAKRFLVTAYNDLKGFDGSLHSDKSIRNMFDEVQQLHKAYKTIKDNLNKPKLAFEIIFLRSQPEYLHFIRYKDRCLSRITVLSQIEESLFPDIQKKEKELKKIPKENKVLMKKVEEEIKKLKRHYVDAIHENASLTDELSTMDDIKLIYTQRYYNEFVSELNQLGGEYMHELTKILNYRAYDLDKLIWERAAESKKIQDYFANSNIKGGYSMITFLRYYLRTLDKEKLKDRQNELFEFLEYLEERENNREG